MDKVISLKERILFKKACGILRQNNIPFEEEKLKEDIELCKRIVMLVERYGEAKE